VNSILNQTYDSFELLITDDCSNDGSIEILKRIEKKDKRIKVLYSDENKGISHNINKGFRQARGKYIAIIAGDDMMKPEKLEKQVQVLKDNPEIGLCMHDMEVFDSSTKKTMYLFSEKNKIPKRIEENLFFTNWFFYRDHVKTIPSSSLAKREYYLQNLFDERLKYYNEILHGWLNYAGQPDVKYYFIDEALGRYRIHENNLHSSKKMKEKGMEELHITFAVSSVRFPGYVGKFKSFVDYNMFSSLLFNWIPEEKRRSYYKLFYKQAGILKFLYLLFCKLLKKTGIFFIFFKPLRIIHKTFKSK
jgi:glycosyltransferase involved in cell wall biosynthesis